MSKKTITAEPLNRESFKPYGDIIDSSVGSPGVETATFSFWEQISEIDIDQDKGNPYLTYLTVRYRPFRVNKMERHLKATQATIPLDGQSYITVVAPPEEPDNPEAKPVLAKAKAFICSGNQGINLKRGTWHGPAYPLCESMDFIMIMRAGMPEDDFQVVSLKKRCDKVITINLPE